MIGRRRFGVLLVLAAVMLFAAAGTAFATQTSESLSGAVNWSGSGRIVKTVLVIPGDTLGIDQIGGYHVTYGVTDAKTGKSLAANGGVWTPTSYGIDGAAANVITWKNTSTVPVNATVQIDYAQFSSYSGTIRYSSPFSSLSFSDDWTSKGTQMRLATVYPGHEYTCVVQTLPKTTCSLSFTCVETRQALGSVALSATGPVWSYTNNTSSPMTIAIRDSIGWDHLTAAQGTAIGSLTGMIYYY